MRPLFEGVLALAEVFIEEVLLSAGGSGGKEGAV
jgi:hypothetical protein